MFLTDGSQHTLAFLSVLFTSGVHGFNCTFLQICETSDKHVKEEKMLAVEEAHELLVIPRRCTMMDTGDVAEAEMILEPACQKCWCCQQEDMLPVSSHQSLGFGGRLWLLPQLLLQFDPMAKDDFRLPRRLGDNGGCKLVLKWMSETFPPAFVAPNMAKARAIVSEVMNKL
mgnify:CR=1 FL=1